MATLVQYKQLPVWTEATLPKSLQTQHNTKPGTWAKIIVEAGQLQYDALNDAGERVSTTVITPEQREFWVSPEAWHRVKPLGALRCWVEFYCRPEDYFQKKYQFAAPHRDVQALIQGPLAGQTPLHILDLGCGKGRNATYLSALGHQVTGLDKNVEAIDHLQNVIQVEQIGDRFQVQVYDIESARLSDRYDLILSTVVFQFLKPHTLAKVIQNMQAHTQAQGYNFIISPVSSPAFPCPIDFPSTFAPEELRNYYADWQIHDYREAPGTFHRKDSSGEPIEAMFATLCAKKNT